MCHGADRGGLFPPGLRLVTEEARISPGGGQPPGSEGPRMGLGEAAVQRAGGIGVEAGAPLLHLLGPAALVETGGEQEGRAIGKGLSQMGGERGKAGEGVERRHLPGDVGGGVVELEEKSSAAHFLQLRLPGPDSPQTMAMTEPLSLSAILDDPRYAAAAARVAPVVRAERGAAAACDAIERSFNLTPA